MNPEAYITLIQNLSKIDLSRLCQDTRLKRWVRMYRAIQKLGLVGCHRCGRRVLRDGRSGLPTVILEGTHWNKETDEVLCSSCGGPGGYRLNLQEWVE